MWCPCEVLVVGQQVCCWPHAHARKHSEARSTSVRGVRMRPERIRSAGPRGAWAQGCCQLLPLAASRLLPSSPAVTLPGRQVPAPYVGVSAVCRRLPWLAALADGKGWKGRLGLVTGLLCFVIGRHSFAGRCRLRRACRSMWHREEGVAAAAARAGGQLLVVACRSSRGAVE